jgi:hypothetical protein
MDTIIDEIRKILKGEKKTEFINQILKEKALTDALRQAGFTPSPEDAQERATERPFGVLSKIQKIDQLDLIKLVETIQKINQIDNIANLGTLNQINRIQQINSITQAYFRPSLILNGGFESGDLSNWKDESYSVTVVTTYAFDGKYSAFLPTNMQGFLVQYVNVPTNIVDSIICYWKSDIGTEKKLIILVHYTDGTSTEGVFSASWLGMWTRCAIVPDANKVIDYIGFTTYSASDYGWLDAVDIILNGQIQPKQTVRTDLKVQIEREDLITKSWDLTSGTTTLLSAVSGKRHKIYGWDYEVDADGITEFSASIGGTTVKFGRRKTKGVHALTLIHPIICDVNTALTFQSAGNTSLSLRYITE